MSYLKKLLRSLKKRVSFQSSTRSELLRINAKVVALRASLEQSVKNFEGASALGERRAIDISDVRRLEIEQNLSNHFENRLMGVQEALVRHIELVFNEAQSVAQATATATADELLTQKFAILRREIDGIRALSTPSTNVIEISTERKTQAVDPTIYAAIEERFRGSRELISTRQKAYLPFLDFAKQQQLPVLDLGCGRGEWLEILKNENFNCEGVDTNAVFLNECTQKGLSTTNIDLLSFLSSQSSPRFGAITLFQVAEHLPFDVLVEVFRAARKCLVPGGVFIVETPNSKNLKVGAGTFWIDPTHERPLYPELLEFLSQLVGFEKYESKYSASNLDLYDYSDAQPHTRAILEMLTLAVDGPADYALIATA
jgi:2-polyprenyl-3-methyl-5-hydroxy-6-metoxy-1,4-benzoquinol methylase